jgi:hypothetical protein
VSTGGVGACAAGLPECHCERVHAELAKERQRATRSEAQLAQARAALVKAHACATLRDDGTCDGCFVSAALSPAAPSEGT